MVGEEDPEDPRSFARKSVLQRVIVLSAGSFMNLVTPIVIFTVLFMLSPGTRLIGGSVVINGGGPRVRPPPRAGLQLRRHYRGVVRRGQSQQRTCELDRGKLWLRWSGRDHRDHREARVQSSAAWGGHLAKRSSGTILCSLVPQVLNPPSVPGGRRVVSGPRCDRALAARTLSGTTAGSLSWATTLTQGSIGVMIGTCKRQDT